MFDLFKRWYSEEDATAAMELVVLFPLMMSMMMGCFDLGQGMAINQKTITASQIMADLIARGENLSLDVVEDIILAGELAFDPYPVGSFGYDIVSLKLSTTESPEILWRITENMSPNSAAVDSADDLNDAGSGLIIVTANYKYVPFFTKFWVGDFDMSEVAFFRPRKSSTVICTTCPG